jgi:hypothetical protein
VAEEHGAAQERRSPASAESYGQAAVIGRLADADNTGDRGSSSVSAPYYTSVLRGMRDYLSDAKVLYADGSNLDEVSRIAKQADAVIVVAGAGWDEVGEHVSDDGAEARRPGPEARMKLKVPFIRRLVSLPAMPSASAMQPSLAD